MTRRNLLIFTVVAVLGFGLDWGTKALAHVELPPSDIIVNDRSVSILILVPMLATALALIFIVRSRLIAFAMGLATGGWLGNCLDRNLRGPVTDFIQVPGGSASYQDYCNLADLMLLTSVPLMVIAIFIWMRRRAVLSREAGENTQTANSRLLLLVCMVGMTCGLDWGTKRVFGRLMAPTEIVHDAHIPSRVFLVGAVVLAPFAWGAVRSRWGCVGLGLMIGGFIANLGELVTRGSVLDFIHLPQIGTTVVVTNLADLAVVGGALILLQASLLDIWARRPRQYSSD